MFGFDVGKSLEEMWNKCIFKTLSLTNNLEMSGSGCSGEPGWTSRHLALEHSAGVAHSIVEDDVGGSGVS